MMEGRTSSSILDEVHIDPEIFVMRPDYRVVLLAIDGLRGGPSDASSQAALEEAEGFAAQLLSERGVEEIPHVSAWRDAYRGFGAKPQRTRNSLEALLRRVATGLPRVDRLTDIYNAICVLHLLPVGGEDLDRYVGPPKLSRARGDEQFETFAHGEPLVDHPEPGEVIWSDDVGVTCRIWNWRQTPRTALTGSTTRGLFILDALEPMPTSAVEAAADDLVQRLGGAHLDVAHRLVAIGEQTRAH